MTGGGGHTGDKKFSNNHGEWHALILSNMNQSTFSVRRDTFIGQLYFDCVLKPLIESG